MGGYQCPVDLSVQPFLSRIFCIVFSLNKSAERLVYQQCSDLWMTIPCTMSDC